MKRKVKVCLGIINADTESTVEGYMSAFIAKMCETRLEVRQMGTDIDDYLNSLIHSIEYTIRTTSQREVHEYFERLQNICSLTYQFIMKKKAYEKDQLEVFYIVHFANVQWDLEVIKGIIFKATTYDFDCVGEKSDLVQLSWGHIIFRDFLRVTGFRSIKMAGLVCFNAHKLDGTEVYNMTKLDIKKSYDDYSEQQKLYIENDVDVMNESLNIILNRKENQTITYTHELPSTATGFSRWRMNHDENVIIYDGVKHNVYGTLNKIWAKCRPFLAFFMRAYKGGLSGVHPISQYKLLRNVICYDAVSMYPHKMLFFRMMQPLNSGKFYESDLPLENDKECLKLWNNILEYSNNLNEHGLPINQPDRADIGILPWIGEVEISIDGMRENNGVYMIPCLSKYKVELTSNELREMEKDHRIISSNGKILYCEHVTVITSSVDLYLLHLCYKLKVHAIRTVVYMQWQHMHHLQKRDVWEAYKRKMKITEVTHKGQLENDEYWLNEAGFNADFIKRLNVDEYNTFVKQYKQIIKGDPNGKYGLTVECPIHSDTIVEKTDDLFDIIVTKSVDQKITELISNPETAPTHVKNNDYCAGSSITMWARWHLISLSYYLFQNGFQVHYTDTDSIFVDNKNDVDTLVTRFNDWMKNFFNKSHLAFEDEEDYITIDETGNLGAMEVDKRCKFFRAMGAKCYAYITDDDNIHVTVAGLNSKNFEQQMKKQMTKDEPIQGMILKYFRPNVFITSSGTKKLLINKDNEGFDYDGLWRGPVLVPIGFELVNTNSAFHVHNMRIAAVLQGLKEDYYIGEYTSSSSLFVTDTGIYDKKTYDEMTNRQDDDIYTCIDCVLDDRQPIPGGVVNIGKNGVHTPE